MVCIFYIRTVVRLFIVLPIIVILFLSNALFLCSAWSQVETQVLSEPAPSEPVKQASPEACFTNFAKGTLSSLFEKYTGFVQSIGEHFDFPLLVNYAVNANYMVHKALYDAPNAWVSIRTLLGIGLSIFSGTIFDDYITPHACANENIAIPKNFLINGIFGDPQKIERMRAQVACGLGVCSGDVFVLENNSHFFGIGDIIRAIGQQAGIIDIVALRIADMLNAAGGGNVVAHSNGATAFGLAMYYVRPDVKQNIRFQGFGSQWYIDGEGYGLKIAFNTKDMSDPIPVISPANRLQHWNPVIYEVGSPFFNLKYHRFRRVYAPYIRKIQDMQ